MRVLAGGPARETSSDLYRLHCEGLRAQAFEGVEVVVRHEVVPDVGGPRWHHDKIERVAKARQTMMEAADRDNCTCGHDARYPTHGYDGRCYVPGCSCAGVWQNAAEMFDALFMCDTDLVLGPGVLERMWAVDAPVVFGVFWTKAPWGNSPEIDTWPQVWDRHSFRFTEECWNALVAPGVNEVPVLGGGACTLIRGRGFESRYWPLLESLSAFTDMMIGEDRAYCLGLEARGIAMKAVTGLPIVHLHTPELQTPAKLAEARRMVGLP